MPEAPGDVLHFLQDPRYLRELLQQHSPRLIRVGVVLGGAVGVTTSAAHQHAGVGAGREGGIVRAHGVVAEVHVHGPVGGGGLGGRLARNGRHLDAAGAGVVGWRVGVLVAREVVGCHGCFAVLARLLHAEEPRAPVEQDNSDLEEKGSEKAEGMMVVPAGMREVCTVPWCQLGDGNDVAEQNDTSINC